MPFLLMADSLFDVFEGKFKEVKIRVYVNDVVKLFFSSFDNNH